MRISVKNNAKCQYEITPMYYEGIEHSVLLMLRRNQSWLCYITH